MNVSIDEPELRLFVEAQVRAGRFGSAGEVVAAALAHYRDEAATDDEFDDETAADLRASFEEAARGQTLSVDEAAARLGVTLTRKQGRPGAA